MGWIVNWAITYTCTCTFVHVFMMGHSFNSIFLTFVCMLVCTNSQFINDKFLYNQSVAMEMLVRTGLKEQLFELAKVSILVC